ncbi:MAG: tRNA ((7)-)-methyltransferase [Pseudomonadota bacterium]|jgi:tRNA (guanine-N7-)-methyltransferase
MNAPEHPPIRSYSGRRGHFTSGQRSAYERLLPALSLPFRPSPIDPVATFGRIAPLVLEIGFGMGETTAAIAQSRPEIDILGVEVYPAGVGSLLRKIEVLGLGNIRVIQHDAIAVLESMVHPSSLAAVHVFFPDPWPKARHHKRRLIRPEVVHLIASRLASGGILHCATDWGPYAVRMLEVLNDAAALENTAGPIRLGESPEQCIGFAPRPDGRPLTRFEQRGVRLGHGVWDLVFRRRGDARSDVSAQPIGAHHV